MNKEESINYLKSSGFSEEQIKEIIKAFELKNAKWESGSIGISHCSLCKQQIFTCQDWFNYCPYCGAKMEEE